MNKKTVLTALGIILVIALLAVAFLAYVIITYEELDARYCEDLLTDEIPPEGEYDFYAYMPSHYTDVRATYEATGYTCEIVDCLEEVEGGVTPGQGQVIECIR